MTHLLHIYRVDELTFLIFLDSQVLAYYISFLKTLSLKLNQHTVNFYFNEVCFLSLVDFSHQCFFKVNASR